MTLCRGRWSVGSGGGHVGEEGLLLWRRSSDEVCGLPGEDVGVEVLSLAGVGDHLAVLVDLVIVEPLRRSFSFLVGHLSVPLVPAGRDVGRVVWDWGLVLIWVLVEVHAEEGSAVTALLLEVDGDRVLLVPLGDELLEAPVRGPVAQYVVVVIVEAGEDGGPGGATHRVAHEGFFKGEALLGHQGGYLGHLLSGGVVQVVGEDKEDVGSVGSRLRLFFLRRIGG